MKKLFMAWALLITGMAAFAQTSTVTINTTGNRNKQVIVDGKTYTISNVTVRDSQAVVIGDLAAGQHTLELVRTNANNRNSSTKSTFSLRDGYDLTLTVGANGSISTAETRVARGGNNGRGQLTTAAYNKLYAQVKAKTSSSARATLLESEWNASTKQLTAKQASQLIQLVSTESLRLKLAKQSYTKISDPQSFSLVSNLLSSSVNRTDLNNYIAALPGDDNDDVAEVNPAAPLTDAAFRSVYNEVVAESTSYERIYYLNNFFSRDFNFYTSAQAKQLIELVTADQDRLSAAKNAYRGITDKENYNEVSALLSSTASRSDLATYIRTYDSNNPWRTAMTTASFDKLYQSVYYLNSASGRYTAINKAFTTTGNYFTVAQAKKLIPLVTDEASRLQLSKTAYKVLADQGNYQQFNEFLSSTASRNEFGNYVNGYEGTATVVVKNPMTETDFRTLYRGVQLTFGIGAKYTSLTDIFNTETNYFTVAQAKQLIQLVSSESNRLELAKSSYNNITDPANFTQMYDVLSSQSSRNALM
ncbi:MAG: DUF4476 domain-containing protein, partial [Chitinophagaceae bacterium]